MNIPFPGLLAVAVLGVIVVSLLGAGGWLSFADFASGATRAVGGGLALIAVLLAAYIYFFSHASLKIERSAVTLDIPLYGRMIDRSKVVAGGVRAMDQLDRSEKAPVLRTNGIGLPGFLVGWVRLRDGTKALAALTDMSKAVYVPLSDGTAVVVSVEDPGHVATMLRGASNTQGGGKR